MISMANKQKIGVGGAGSGEAGEGQSKFKGPKSFKALILKSN